MHLQAFILGRGAGRPAKRTAAGASRLPLAVLAVLALGAWAGPLAGCAGTGRGGDGGRSEAAADSVILADLPAGTVPVGAEFLYVFENEANAPYYPIEGLGGVAYAQDGTLIFCDEKGGRVHALEPRGGSWYQFDAPPSRPYRPIDVRVDGFSVLILDFGGRQLVRYDMRGVFQDRLLSFQALDPVTPRLPTAFDVDVDGRVVVTDGAAQQVLLLDAFLSLTQVIGESGSHREQFDAPSGVSYLPDGGFIVADRGNRRLQRFSRLGYFEKIIGGEFDLDNAFITPQGVDVDPFGNVFVADPAAGAVHVLARARRRLFALDQNAGLLAGPEAPIDVAVGPDDLLAVSDRGRDAILVYRIVYD